MEKNDIRKILHRLDLERRQLMRPKFLEMGLTVGEGQPRILNCLLEQGEMSQRELADVARDLNCREVLFADLLSEANTALLMALEELKDVTEEEAAEEWLMHKVRSLVEEFLEEQTRQKREDNFLVEKVQNLEERVKALTEDENVKYSVEELAVFLDMEPEEMEAILRLTGDDSGK